MKLQFYIPGVPVAQPRQRHALIGGHVRNFTPKDSPVHAYKATCRVAFNNVYDGEPLPNAFQVHLVFLFPRPKRMIWKSRPMTRSPFVSKPDADNLAKSTLDSLNSICWVDDSQVASLTVEKWYAAGNEQPGVEVTISDFCD
jgi:Holliday junction resolvase RusA-like endonuclease